MNADKQQRLIRKLRLELGEVVQAALDDPEVIEVMLNPNGEIWIERFGREMQIGPVSTKLS